MKGLEAISHYHGVSLAVLGVTVVFIALVVLALIISRLHAVLGVWENPKAWLDQVRLWFFPEKPEKDEPPGPYFDDIHESARQLNLLIHAIGEPFSLPALIGKAEKIGISHAHSVVSHLIVTHLIVPDKKGYFYWNQKECDRLLGKGRERKRGVTR